MTDGATFPLGPSRAGDAGTAAATLKTAQRATQRADAYASADDARTLAAIQRLKTMFSSGQALRRDAPPGYYLDLRV